MMDNMLHSKRTWDRTHYWERYFVHDIVFTNICRVV